MQKKPLFARAAKLTNYILSQLNVHKDITKLYGEEILCELRKTKFVPAITRSIGVYNSVGGSSSSARPKKSAAAKQVT